MGYNHIGGKKSDMLFDHQCGTQGTVDYVLFTTNGATTVTLSFKIPSLKASVAHPGVIFHNFEEDFMTYKCTI